MNNVGKFFRIFGIGTTMILRSCLKYIKSHKTLLPPKLHAYHGFITLVASLFKKDYASQFIKENAYRLIFPLKNNLN